MVEKMPASIRTFEALQILSVLVGLVHAAAVSPLSAWDTIVTVGPVLALTFFASRKRRTWPRVVLTVMFAGGLAFMVAKRDLVFAQGYPLVTLGITLAQGVALLMLYTKSASAWLRGR